MGQSLKKFAPGSEEKKIKEIHPIIEKYYDEHSADLNQIQNIGELYHEICSTVEQINLELGNTQFKLPTVGTLQDVYNVGARHHKGKGKKLTKEDFQAILKEVIKDSGFTGIGAKEALLYIFGVPVATLMIKQRVMPRVMRDEFFIPGVTSLTVLILAGLNKI